VRMAAASTASVAGRLATVVVAGPSGAGKSTLISMLMKEFPENFALSCSHTTRKPRPNEVDGIHYYFTDRPTMQRLISEDQFVEHAEYSGNLYGTSLRALEAIRDAGKIALLDIEMNGVRQIKQSALQALFVFIRPPSIDELRRRLILRGEKEPSLSRRLETTARELAEMESTPGLFDEVLLNENLDECYEQFRAVFQRRFGIGKTHSAKQP